MQNQLYGKEFILRERSSGYRSTSYAIAELVDNSVDAEAKNVDIYFIDKVQNKKNSSRTAVSEIFICDDGKGMGQERINSCLTFSEGEGQADDRIGSFGVGLPKSSISIARRVEVYSREDADSIWRMVYLDIDELIKREVPAYSAAIELNPDFPFMEDRIGKYKTIIRWQKPDRVDYKKGSTLSSHLLKLFGRLYRYRLGKGLSLKTISLVENQDGRFASEENSALMYDPLFLTPGRTYISDKVWDSLDNVGVYKHSTLGHMPEFNSHTYYRKYTEGYSREQGCSAIFEGFEGYNDVEHEILLNGKTYKWKMYASYAPKDITNPGLRSGGATVLGKAIGEKMDGSINFKSGNIFFVRADREIDFGSFGMYKASDVKNRFWTIEVHFDSELDELMGLSNNKQSVQFNHVRKNEIEPIKKGEALSLGAMREHLWSDMTYWILKAIKEINKVHSGYSRDFISMEKAAIKESDGSGVGPIESVEPAIIQALPLGKTWSEEVVNEVTDFLKSRFMSLELDKIKEQVQHYADGKTNTLVLYAPNDTRDLFELVAIRGKKITLINTNHHYYRNVIAPLKTVPELSVFTLSIEMLISSLSLQMEDLIISNENKYKIPLQNYSNLFSITLSDWIEEGKIEVNIGQYIQERETYLIE